MYAVYLHHTDQSTGNCGRKHRIRIRRKDKGKYVAGGSLVMDHPFSSSLMVIFTFEMLGRGASGT